VFITQLKSLHSRVSCHHYQLVCYVQCGVSIASQSF